MSAAGIRTAPERAAIAASAAIVKRRTAPLYVQLHCEPLKQSTRFDRTYDLQFCPDEEFDRSADAGFNRNGRSMKTFETNRKQKRLSHRMFVIELRRNSLRKAPLETLSANLLSSLNVFSLTRMMKIPNRMTIIDALVKSAAMIS